jgi:hypothetical protein
VDFGTGTGSEQETPPDVCSVGIGCVVAVPRAVAELGGTRMPDVARHPAPPAWPPAVDLSPDAPPPRA